MDPQLIKAIEEKMPTAENRKINQASLYGTFGKSPELSLADEQITILGLVFSPVDLYTICGPTPLRRTIFIIEDKSTGEVHMQESSRRSQGIGLIKSGKLGTIFEKRFGSELCFDKIRVWWANEAGDIEKYQIETYFLARLADKNKRDERARVMRRQYDRMTVEQRNTWRAKYPYAAEVVLKDHEDYNLRRS